MSTFALVLLIIVVALVFDYTNGFHDAANSIATVVSTRVLSPGKAVALAAFFNFVAAFGFGTHVASTIGKGLIDLNQVSEWVILSGLIGAIAWNIITWYLGLPTSSSHALVGGYAGAAVAKSGFGVLLWDKWPKGWPGTLSFIVLSPLMGMVLGFFLMVAVYWLFRNFSPSRVDKLFRRLQILSASLYSLSHGLNDAQKTMGIMLAALILGNYHPKTAEIPFGLSSRLTRRLRWGRCRAAGASSRLWDRRSPSSAPSAVSVRKRQAESPSFWLPVSASRSRPRIRSRARLSRWLDQATLGGALGRGGPHRMGLGLDDPDAALIAALTYAFTSLFR